MQILYHGNCPDGFGAALVAWLVYGDNAIYIPVYHNQPVPEITSKKVIIIDASLASLRCLGGDNNDTICSFRTINCC